MSDKPQAIPQPPTAAGNARFTALSDHHVIELAGRDAVAFAQAQFMSDVAALDPGYWHWSGWLTPKGRVIALFALLKLDDETIRLLLPDADPGELVDQLKRFVFRSKLAISVRGDLAVSGAFAAPAQAAGGGLLAGDPASGLEMDFSAEGGPRTLRIDSQSGRAEDPQATARWSGFDLTHGLPRLDVSQSGQWTPQQLSLQRLQAYSVKKGCYPGQEIVARTHFLGQAKRGLALFDAQGEVHPGSEVHMGEQSLGTVVSTAATVAGVLALAVLPLERDAAAMLRAGNIALRERALLDGLAR